MTTEERATLEDLRDKQMKKVRELATAAGFSHDQSEFLLSWGRSIFEACMDHMHEHHWQVVPPGGMGQVLNEILSGAIKTKIIRTDASNPEPDLPESDESPDPCERARHKHRM